MSRIEELIKEKCPDGVEYKPLYEVTTWDKNFKGVEKSKQPKVIKYSVMLAADLFALEQPEGDVFLLSTGEQTGWTTEELAGDNISEGEVVTIPWGKSRKVVDCIKYYKGKFVTGDNRIMTSNNLNQLDNKYLYYCILSKGDVIDTFYRGAGIQHPDMYSMLNLEIPVPPMEVQQEIVRILDKFTELEVELQAELDARKKQYEHYRDELLVFDEDVPEAVEYKSLADVYEYRRGSFPQPYTEASFYGGDNAMPFVQVADISDEGFKLNEITNQTISEKAQPKSVFVPQGTVIVSLQGTIGRVAITQYDTYVDRTVAIFTKPKIENLDSKFFAYVLKQKFDYAKQFARGSTIKTITKEEFSQFEIPIPPIEIQKEVVCILDKFTELRSNLQVELEMCHKQYEYYRDKLLTFERKEV